MKLAGLTSDRGRTLLHLADVAPGGADLGLLVADDPDAPALDAAERRGVPTAVVPFEGDRPAHEERLVEALAAADVDLVCAESFDRPLSRAYAAAAPTTLALSPSLHPTVGGRDDPVDALESSAALTGCTVAVVADLPEGDAGVGRAAAGPIVTQEPVPIYADDDPAAVRERVENAAARAYPRAVGWFAAGQVDVDREAGTVAVAADEGGPRPGRYLETADRRRELRYGENPHQAAAVYRDYAATGASVVAAPQLNGGAKALSYNNYNDADAAVALAAEFERPAAAVIKHTNPAGCAVADTVAGAYERALATDAKSAFGGVVALNRECDAATANAITDSFKEVVAAPGYTDDALATLRETDDLRVLDVTPVVGADPERPLGEPPGGVVEKHLVGGRLLQDRDRGTVARGDIEVVTEAEPTAEQVETMLFAWRVVRHVKSNAIVLATGTETVGIGAGQVSRVDAVDLAARKADRDAEGKGPEGAVMASDAFFPFADGVEAAADAGVAAVVQPGGSVNDDEVVAACDDRGIAMAHTGRRAFRHD